MNVTLITQLLPTATLVPHVLVCEKSMAFVPEMLMPVPVMLSGAFPVFDRVTVCAADCVLDGCAVNVREAGLRSTTGPLAVTVMEKFVEDVRLAVSVTVTVTV